MRPILRQGLTVAVAGLAAGWLVARALTRSLAGVLFEVCATDPLAWVASAALLLIMATAACRVPARAAAGIDPIRALQAE